MMKLLNEIIENPFDPDRFKKLADLIFGGLKQSAGVYEGVSDVKSFKLSDESSIAVFAVCSGDVLNGSRNDMVREILASLRCDAAVTAFYEDNATEWKLSCIRLIKGSRAENGTSTGSCGIKKASFIMGAGGGREAGDLTGIVNSAAKRQLLGLLRKKGQVALKDVEKAFSYNVFTRNVIRDFNIKYPEITDFSEIVGLPGFKMPESGPYDREFAIDPEMLGNIFESRLKKRDRKSRGTFYTPSGIVSFMCRESLAQYVSNATDLPCEECRGLLGLDAGIDPWRSDITAESLVKVDRALQQVRIFDPAAGSGAFVLGMLREIVRVRHAVSERISAYTTVNSTAECRADIQEPGTEEGPDKSMYGLMLHTIGNCIFAADIDEEAVRLTRLRLRCALASAADGRVPGDLICHVACGDSLNDGGELSENDPAFGGVYSEKGGFDIVIGNPPYISAVEDARRGNTPRDSLKARYPILKGFFDIYTAFLLEGTRQTNADGVYCWIVPNSLLSSRYARPVFEYLKYNGLNRTISASGIDIFHSVGVYPVIAIGNKKVKEAGYKEYIAASADDPGLAVIKSSPCLTEYGTFWDHGIRIASGAAGFQARSLAECISEEERELAIPFVVSGSIDKYSTSFKNIRFMGKTWPKAYVTKSRDIAQRKWNLWCGEKIIIAGLTRELEADYSREPLALGVGAYAIYDFGGFDPLYLLGLLNSRFMSVYLRDRFYEKHLAGGYLAINKATLEQLPLAPADPDMQRAVAEKVGAVKALMQQLQAECMASRKVEGNRTAAGKAGKAGKARMDNMKAEEAQRGKLKNLLADIDELVDRLYA